MTVLPFSLVSRRTTGSHSDAGEDATTSSPAPTLTVQRAVAIEMAKAWVNDAEARRAYLLQEYASHPDPLALVCSTELGLASAAIKGLLEAFQ